MENATSTLKAHRRLVQATCARVNWHRRCTSKSTKPAIRHQRSRDKVDNTHQSCTKSSTSLGLQLGRCAHRVGAFHVKSLLHSAYKHKPIIHPGISSEPARPLAPDSVQKDEKIQGRVFKTSTSQHEQRICISSQSAPSPLEAVGPSVRGFMLCIAACSLRGVQPCPSP